MIDCSISIVNYNTRDLLEKCIASVIEHTKAVSYEIIVADNASTDGSVERVQSRFPQVKVIRNPENLFFTKASNQGLRASQGRFLITLNPDCYLEEDAISAMVLYLEKNPEVGACGAVFLNPDGSVQSLGHRFPGLLYPFFHFLFINAFFPSNPVRRSRDYKESKLMEIDAMGGGGILVRREILDTVGVLDEDFLMYCEDTDWCKRIRARGWTIMHLPEARIFHHGGAATVKVNRRRFDAILNRSLIHYYRKHYGLWAALPLWLIYHGIHIPVLKISEGLRGLGLFHSAHRV